MISESGRFPGEGIGYPLQYSWASLVAQLVKNPPAMWETWVRSLGWKGPLEKGKEPTPVFWPGEFRGLYSTNYTNYKLNVKRHSTSFVIQFSSVQFSRSVVSDSLQPHELQHARPPCPSPSPGIHSNSGPLSH